MAWGRLLSICSSHPKNATLEKEEVVLGRGEKCDIVIVSPMRHVSTTHCIIRRTGPMSAKLKDCSMNGTFVDGKEVGKGKEVNLDPGCKISLTHPDVQENEMIRFVFSFVPSPSPPRPSATGKPVPVTSTRCVEDDYEIGDVLGKGAFAVVKRGVHKATGEKVAVKVIDKKRAQLSALSHDVEQMVQGEIRILKGLKHPNIVRLLDAYDTDRFVYIVLELVSSGELFDKILIKSKFTEQQAQGLFHQMVLGINYLHSKGVAHRDLKPENILLHKVSQSKTSGYILKITDFGLSQIARSSNAMKTIAGTPQYIAPEILLSSGTGQGYGVAVDMWSLGVILYILLCGQMPFGDSEEDPLDNRIKEGRADYPPKLWDGVSDSAKSLVRGLLVVDPAVRMTAAQVLAHPWMPPRQEKLQAAAAAVVTPRASGAAGLPPAALTLSSLEASLSSTGGSSLIGTPGIGAGAGAGADVGTGTGTGAAQPGPLAQSLSEAPPMVLSGTVDVARTMGLGFAFSDRVDSVGLAVEECSANFDALSPAGGPVTGSVTPVDCMHLGALAPRRVDPPKAAASSLGGAARAGAPAGPRGPGACTGSGDVGLRASPEPAPAPSLSSPGKRGSRKRPSGAQDGNGEAEAPALQGPGSSAAGVCVDAKRTRRSAGKL